MNLIGPPSLPLPGSPTFQQDLVRILLPYFNTLHSQLAGAEATAQEQPGVSAELLAQIDELQSLVDNAVAALSALQEQNDSLKEDVTRLTNRPRVSLTDLTERVERLEAIVKMD